MITIAVCDDEIAITSQIETLLSNLCEKEQIPVQIDVFFSGQKLTRHILPLPSKSERQMKIRCLSTYPDMRNI